jgi:hypothetical protein
VVAESRASGNGCAGESAEEQEGVGCNQD